LEPICHTAHLTPKMSNKGTQHHKPHHTHTHTHTHTTHTAHTQTACENTPPDNELVAFQFAHTAGNFSSPPYISHSLLCLCAAPLTATDKGCGGGVCVCVCVCV